jgi:hypothetical protein
MGLTKQQFLIVTLSPFLVTSATAETWHAHALRFIVTVLGRHGQLVGGTVGTEDVATHATMMLATGGGRGPAEERERQRARENGELATGRRTHMNALLSYRGSTQRGELKRGQHKVGECMYATGKP